MAHIHVPPIHERKKMQDPKDISVSPEEHPARYGILTPYFSVSSRDSLPFSFRPSGSSTPHKHHYEKPPSDNAPSNIHQRNCHFKGKIGPKNIKEIHIIQLQSHTLSIKNRFYRLHLTEELFTSHSSPPSHPAKQTRHTLLTAHLKLQENGI